LKVGVQFFDSGTVGNHAVIHNNEEKILGSYSHNTKLRNVQNISK
jgi:hypothetical protein